MKSVYSAVRTGSLNKTACSYCTLLDQQCAIWTHVTVQAIVRCLLTTNKGKTNVTEGAVGFVRFEQIGSLPKAKILETRAMTSVRLVT